LNNISITDYCWSWVPISRQRHRTAGYNVWVTAVTDVCIWQYWNSDYKRSSASSYRDCFRSFYFPRIWIWNFSTSLFLLLKWVWYFLLLYRVIQRKS